MINFSTLKSLTIPEGKVKQMIDSNGNALWCIKLLSIAVTTPPTKTEYQEGEVFDPAGMVITATYSNGETKVVTNYTILNGDQISEDMTTVNISYTEDGVAVGTAYEVGFVEMATISLYISAMYRRASSYVIIDGVTYNLSTHPSINTTIEVPVGSEIICKGSKGSYANSHVRVNGTSVAYGDTIYTYVVTGNISIKITEKSTSTPSGTEYQAHVEITEQ